MERKKGIEVYELIEGRQVIELIIKESEFGGKGWIEMKRKWGKIYLDSYDTKNSPIHNFTGFPGNTLLYYKSHLEEKGESNYFQLYAYTCFLKTKPKEVITVYEFPYNYTGPHYHCRRIKWEERGHLIVPFYVEMTYVEMTYEDLKVDLKVDKAKLVKIRYSQNILLTYEWQCEYGANKFNIHNTGYENKFKPPQA